MNHLPNLWYMYMLMCNYLVITTCVEYQNFREEEKLFIRACLCNYVISIAVCQILGFSDFLPAYFLSDLLSLLR